MSKPQPRSTERTPGTHEPPAGNERPDQDLPGEQPRSRSNEGDPANPTERPGSTASQTR